MARNDIRIHQSPYSVVPTYNWVVAAGTPVTVKAGEPTKVTSTSSNAVILLVDADLTIATDQPFTGVAAKDSTETAAATGLVELYKPLDGIEYEMAAKSSTAADSASEILALQGAYYVMDLTSSTFTMDTAAGDAAANAFLIVGGDPAINSVWFMIRSDATVFGRARV